MTSITHGNPPVPAGSIFIDRPKICQTLDEVFVVVPRETFDKIRFDERICTGWHLYAVDFCLSAGERLQEFCLAYEFASQISWIFYGRYFLRNSKESGFKAQEEL